MSRRALLLGVACAAVAAGCGDRRTAPPDVTRPANPVSFTRAMFPTQGVFFRGPTNWLLIHGYPPQVATLQDGQAIVAIWRYPRAQPVPATHAELRARVPAFLKTVRARDPTFALLGARATTLDRHPAIEVKGFETNAGQPFQVRSVHAFYSHSEYVFDSTAPPSDFARIDRLVFEPVLRSVHLRSPLRTGTRVRPAAPLGLAPAARPTARPRTAARPKSHPRPHG